MSFDGHVLCQRMLMTPWALATFGAATADAAAATLRKLRRVGRTGFDDFVMAFLSLYVRPAALAPADFINVTSLPTLRCRERQLNCRYPDNQGLHSCRRRSRRLPLPTSVISASVLRRARRITLPHPPCPGNV